MNKQIEQYFSTIISKIKKLKARTQRLEAENEELRKSVFNYLQQMELQKKETEKMLSSMQHEQMGMALNSDKKVLLKEIDKYILMIDKCIAAVNSNL